ncbi:molecular chaperone DnaJ [Sphingobium sufflavum]|uniref:molecular chaperone DnaJ n=1 Tax=Sphingobium sufflavum TaxID=1129547 RepID=UPI001F4582D6|nr:molecular chaperone DnaJ [Sphingobium sufflavum]MCE7795524.1 molecular chaperone DnaJ [Sphingobium sufflavum]
MGLLALLVGGWLGWLVWQGRIARPSNSQIAALVLAIAGGAIAAKGAIIPGGMMAATGLAWLSRKPRKAKAPSSATPIPDAQAREALAVLGLSPDADRAAVIDAHRRLIARNHPDAGGTEALARSINAARDTLLARLPVTGTSPE